MIRQVPNQALTTSVSHSIHEKGQIFLLLMLLQHIQQTAWVRCNNISRRNIYQAGSSVRQGSQGSLGDSHFHQGIGKSGSIAEIG
jgi:hypothetical protein